MSDKDKNIRKCSGCFAILADKTRMHILKNLRNSRSNVTEITCGLKVSQPTVSHHLRVLGDRGFIKREKCGRETYYEFNKNGVCDGCRVFSAPMRI